MLGSCYMVGKQGSAAMPASQFDEFVSQAQARRTEIETVDWSQRLRDWQQDIQSLYATVRDLLHAYIDDGRIALSEENILLNDERFDTYSTQTLILTIGTEAIRFLPVSAFVIGAHGRVDVLGPKGRARLVLVERESKRVSIRVTIVDPSKPPTPHVPPARDQFVWKIAGSRPTGAFTDLTQETLQGLILEVANG